jgi:hypothetical protein
MKLSQDIFSLLWLVLAVQFCNAFVRTAGFWSKNKFSAVCRQSQIPFDYSNAAPSQPCSLSTSFETHIKIITRQLDDVFESARNNREFDTRGAIANILNSVDLCKTEYSKFALADPNLLYTRNLVATDHQNYMLLLLRWNCKKESPIHDHPCDGCYVKVLAGTIEETLYNKRSSDGILHTKSTLYKVGELSMMNDEIGLHKIGNPSNDEDAITLHLYTPPFEKCKVHLRNL